MSLFGGLSLSPREIRDRPLLLLRPCSCGCRTERVVARLFALDVPVAWPKRATCSISARSNLTTLYTPTRLIFEQIALSQASGTSVRGFSRAAKYSGSPGRAEACRHPVAVIAPSIPVPFVGIRERIAASVRSPRRRLHRRYPRRSPGSLDNQTDDLRQREAGPPAFGSIAPR